MSAILLFGGYLLFIAAGGLIGAWASWKSEHDHLFSSVLSLVGAGMGGFVFWLLNALWHACQMSAATSA